MNASLNTTSDSFDDFGRYLPLGLNAPAHQKTRRWFLFSQPDIDYAGIHARTAAHLSNNGELGTSAAEFSQRAEAIRSRLLADPQLAGLTRA